MPIFLAAVFIVMSSLNAHPALSVSQHQDPAAAYLAAQSGIVASDVFVVEPAPSLPMKVNPGDGEAEELGPVITAESAAVVDGASGAVLFGKRQYAVRSLASITKLLTAIAVVYADPDWHREITVTADDIPKEGNTVLRVGDRVSTDDLLTAMLVRSDNAAAKAVARELGGDLFIQHMRELARGMGFFSLRLNEPSGLAVANRGTAIDAARLLRAALTDSVIAERLRLPETTIAVHGQREQSISVRSTNALLFDGRHAFDVIGGKTGYIDEAGFNFCVEVERDGHPIIVAVLGSATHDDRFRDARILADWIFKNYEW